MKTVVVTGANSGIGRATALLLTKHGYDVVGTVRGEEKAVELKAAGVRTAICDVTDAEATEAAFAAIGPVWAVVNNAGYAQPGAIEDVPDDLARAQLETNVVAPMRIARLVVPGMRERGGGRIVNVSSISGRVSFPLLGWYHASKHALETLTDSLRMEVARDGIHVVLVEPGSFETGIWADGRSRLPDRPDSRYRSSYDRASAERALRRMRDPATVARTIRRALESPRPLSRYLVGLDAIAGTFLDSLAPEILSDWVKRAATGLTAR